MVLGLSCDSAYDACNWHPNGDLFPDQEVVVEKIHQSILYTTELCFLKESQK